jgi:hypothetical protein
VVENDLVYPDRMHLSLVSELVLDPRIAARVSSSIHATRRRDLYAASASTGMTEHDGATSSARPSDRVPEPVAGRCVQPVRPSG